MADYDQLTKDQLQDILRDRDLPVSGNKDELVERLNEADSSKAEALEASEHVRAHELVEEHQAEVAEEVAEQEPEDLSPELQVLQHLQAQEREALEADPTLSALAQVQLHEPEVEEVELDESVAALLTQSERAQNVGTPEEALEAVGEVGGRADVQQQLLQLDHNQQAVGIQRPLEVVHPLYAGALAGITLDSSKDGSEPGFVTRIQRRAGAPLDEELSAQWTFPVGEAQPEAEQEDAHEVDEGEGPFTLTQEAHDAE